MKVGVWLLVVQLAALATLGLAGSQAVMVSRPGIPGIIGAGASSIYCSPGDMKVIAQDSSFAGSKDDAVLLRTSTALVREPRLVLDGSGNRIAAWLEMTLSDYGEVWAARFTAAKI